jgi:O-acetylserine/cysteine efflux transporter
MNAERLAGRGWVALLGGVVLFGGSWPVTKFAITAGADPLWFAAGRAVLSGAAAFLLAALGGRLAWPGRRDLPALGAIGLFQFGFFFFLAHTALAGVSAGRTAVLANTTTIFVLPLSLLFLHEKISRQRAAAALLGLIGVVLLMRPWAAAPLALGREAMLLGAALSWALAIILVRRYPPRLSMFALMPWCFALASLVLVPLARLHAPLTPWPRPALLAEGFMGLIAGPLGTWCVLEATVTLPAVVASLGFLATPAVGLLISALWLGEPLDPPLLLGTVLILGALALAARPSRARSSRASAFAPPRRDCPSPP